MPITTPRPRCGCCMQQEHRGSARFQLQEGRKRRIHHRFTKFGNFKLQIQSRAQLILKVHPQRVAARPPPPERPGASWRAGWALPAPKQGSPGWGYPKTPSRPCCAKMGCFTFIKVMMILFNLAIFLGGGALLGVGIWVTVDGQSFLKIFGTLSSSVLQVVNVSYFLIVIGAILVIIGFLGCYGAQKESKCLLMMFFSVVLIIFIAEIAAAVVVLVYTSLAETFLTAVVTPILKENYGANDDFTRIWNATMSEVGCCGLNNYTDFENSPWYTQHKTYPPPCCDNKYPCNESLAAGSHVQGCFDQILEDIKMNADVVGGVAAGIAALEIAAMAVSMYLYCHLDQK
nr:tetraspanin-1 isoform X1 [Anser cygnoides]